MTEIGQGSNADFHRKNSLSTPLIEGLTLSDESLSDLHSVDIRDRNVTSHSADGHLIMNSCTSHPVAARLSRDYHAMIAESRELFDQVATAKKDSLEEAAHLSEQSFPVHPTTFIRAVRHHDKDTDICLSQRYLDSVTRLTKQGERLRGMIKELQDQNSQLHSRDPRRVIIGGALDALQLALSWTDIHPQDENVAEQLCFGVGKSETKGAKEAAAYRQQIRTIEQHQVAFAQTGALAPKVQ